MNLLCRLQYFLWSLSSNPSLILHSMQPSQPAHTTPRCCPQKCTHAHYPKTFLTPSSTIESTDRRPLAPKTGAKTNNSQQISLVWPCHWVSGREGGRKGGWRENRPRFLVRGGRALKIGLFGRGNGGGLGIIGGPRSRPICWRCMSVGGARFCVLLLL